MNMKVVLLVGLTLVILGVPASFAHPQYIPNLTAVYGDRSCGTCHVSISGGGSLKDYGTLFKNQPDHAANASAALIAIGAPPTANPTVTSTLIATSTPAVTTVTATATSFPPVATATPAAPGFGIVLSLIGLLSWSFLAKRNNK